MKEFISFKSISTDHSYKKEMIKCANRLVEKMKNNGFNALCIQNEGNPIVYGEYDAGANETVLIYGHYDVQPAEKDDGRDSDPFQLIEQGDKLFARGAVDNKGQVGIHLVSIFDLIQNGNLKYNIKFFIEGDEETGSPYLEEIVEENKELLSCDYVLISDGEMIGDTIPTMVAGFRGGVNIEIKIKTANTDLHSGLYGNIAPSASHIASTLVSRIYGEDNLITIPGRYNDVADVDKEQFNKIEYDYDRVKSVTGIKGFSVPIGYHPSYANGVLPTIQVSGISSGYTGNGYKNIIPGHAVIKINFRFGKGQNPSNKVELFKSRVAKTLHEYAEHEITYSDPYEAISIDNNHSFSIKVQSCLLESFSHSPVIRYCGAAVPVSGMFQDILNAKVAIADLGNEDCNMHGVHENISKNCVIKGIEFSTLLFGEQ